MELGRPGGGDAEPWGQPYRICRREKVQSTRGLLCIVFLALCRRVSRPALLCSRGSPQQRGRPTLTGCRDGEQPWLLRQHRALPCAHKRTRPPRRTGSPLAHRARKRRPGCHGVCVYAGKEEEAKMEQRCVHRAIETNVRVKVDCAVQEIQRISAVGEPTPGGPCCAPGTFRDGEKRAATPYPQRARFAKEKERELKRGRASADRAARHAVRDDWSSPARPALRSQRVREPPARPALVSPFPSPSWSSSPDPPPPTQNRPHRRQNCPRQTRRRPRHQQLGHLSAAPARQETAVDPPLRPPLHHALRRQCPHPARAAPHHESGSAPDPLLHCQDGREAGGHQGHCRHR